MTANALSSCTYRNINKISLSCLYFATISHLGISVKTLQKLIARDSQNKLSSPIRINILTNITASIAILCKLKCENFRTFYYGQIHRHATTWMISSVTTFIASPRTNDATETTIAVTTATKLIVVSFINLSLRFCAQVQSDFVKCKKF